MKAMKRLMAALLAVAIMVSAAPVMRTQAADAPTITAKFVAWGVTGGKYDCSTCYVGIDAKYNVTDFQYRVYTQDGKRLLRAGNQFNTYYTVNGKKCVKVEGGRKTVLTSVRIRAKINGTWSAWTGLIGIIPIHTSDYVRVSFNSSNPSWKIAWDKFTGMTDYEVWISTTGKGGWKRMTRTTGTSYTFSKWNGAKVKKWQDYYIKVKGRAKIGSTTAYAKGDSDTYYIWKVYYY